MFEAVLGTMQGVIGLVLGLAALVGGVVAWLNRRMQAAVREGTSQVGQAHAGTVTRLDRLEEDVTKLGGAVKEIGRHVEGVEDRVSSVERNLETVARAADVAQLRAEMGELRGTITAELRALSGQVDTMYRAAVRFSAPADE